jgi:hypothetical protein
LDHIRADGCDLDKKISVKENRIERCRKEKTISGGEND